MDFSLQNNKIFKINVFLMKENTIHSNTHIKYDYYSSISLSINKSFKTIK